VSTRLLITLAVLCGAAIVAAGIAQLLLAH
jgi:hypothetical protein